MYLYQVAIRKTGERSEVAEIGTPPVLLISRIRSKETEQIVYASKQSKNLVILYILKTSAYD
jgi:hypothetical protein